jgi:hypothetical protein
LRPTALSNHFAQNNDEGESAAWAGNSPSTWHRFYNGLVSLEQAKIYWALTPATLDLSNVIKPSRAA